MPEPLRRVLRVQALWWPTLLTAGFICLVTFVPKGGLNLESMTTTEIVVTLLAGLLAAGAILVTPAARSLLDARRYGLWPLGLLVAFTALSAVSIVWSVQPDASYQDACRLLAYSAVFGASVALVRLAPERWPAILGGVALGTFVVCAYALATKVFPGELAPLVTYARLEEPFGYWNAIGLTAALGSISCMWLGARRSGHGLLSALAYPALGVMLVTLMLAYSRGALVALLIGLALWFCIVPLRLRGAALLIVAGLGAGAVVAWDFSRHALTTDGVALGERASAGHQLGTLLVVMVVVLALVGIAIGFTTARRAPAVVSRRRAGALLVALMVIAVIGAAGALAHSHRGFTGSISHAVSTLTNPNAKPPPNTPGRLTAVASVRARYWKEALEVFAAHPVLGAGADGYETARLRYRTATLEVKHAHGFVVQTLADLGAFGLLLALALLFTWMAAAGRATHPFNRRWTSWGAWRELRSGRGPGWRRLRGDELTRYTSERIGLLTMVCLVVVFGAHSFVDWTWYVPGDALVALLCAGWLAGHGPLSLASSDWSLTRVWPAVRPLSAHAARAATNGLEHPGRSSHGTGAHVREQLTPMRVGVAVAVIIATLLAAWSQWQPQRSVNASQRALALLASAPQRALAQANAAVSRDPLSAQALFTLATVQQARGESARARATLERAVRRQPSNPQTWLELGRYDLVHAPADALEDFQAAIYLNPESIAPEAIADGNREAIAIQNNYIEALRALQGRSAGVPGSAGRSARAAQAGRVVGRARSAATGATAGSFSAAAVRRRARAARRRAERAARRAARRHARLSQAETRSPAAVP
ncbi:MAG TPA: O-antigen ligase family protein [Solirubrobacteraceae bacterium]|nr:O-antigen ligase family protein [Solirubrobacteraceae bacterium]